MVDIIIMHRLDWYDSVWDLVTGCYCDYDPYLSPSPKSPLVDGVHINIPDTYNEKRAPGHASSVRLVTL